MWKFIVIWLVGTWFVDPCSSIPENASDYYMSSSHGSDCIALHGHYDYRECRKEFTKRIDAIAFIENAPIKEIYALGSEFVTGFELDSIWVEENGNRE